MINLRIMSIISLKKVWFSISSVLVLASILALMVFKLPLGIDFTGGSLLEVSFSDTSIEKSQIEQVINDSSVQTTIQVQKTGDEAFILRMRNLAEDEHQTVLTDLRTLSELEERRFDSIGPVIGQELQEKAFWAIVLVLIAIVIYVAYAFSSVSRPIESWKYGIIALIALFHDIIITLGIFAVLGHYAGLEVGLPFVAALLTILGYSVNDTIVVFDRIRESIKEAPAQYDFAELIDKSVNATISRSINTSVTTLFVLFAIIFFGGGSIQNFILALIIGIFIGTYSSIFLASPLLYQTYLLQQK